MSTSDLFKDKVVLISGAARGQGREHAVRFAREGAVVVGFDVCAQIESVQYPMPDEDDLRETERLVREAGGDCRMHVTDVRDDAAVEAVVKSTVSEFARLDVAVANAGVTGQFRPIWEMDPLSFRTTIEVNVVGVWNTLRFAARAMVDSGRPGAVTVIASGSSLKGQANIGDYVASKHALVGLVRTSARELGAHGVRVNAVLPGNTDTMMIRNDNFVDICLPDLPSEERTEAEFARRLAINSPMGLSWVDPGDISEAVLWISSDRARYVTGVLLPVDGGTAIP